MGDPWSRAAGAILLLASVGVAWTHRELTEALRGGPAEMSDSVVGLLTVALAIAGTLLLRRPRLSPLANAPTPTAPPLQTRRALTVKRLLAAGSPEGVLLDTRHGVALILAYRALAIVAGRRAISGELLSDQAGMAYRRSAVRGRL